MRKSFLLMLVGLALAMAPACSTFQGATAYQPDSRGNLQKVTVSDYTGTCVVKNGTTIAAGDVVEFEDIGGGSVRCASIYTNTSAGSENIIGLATTGGTGDAGGTVSITYGVINAVVTGYSGLTVGARYYTDPDGGPPKLYSAGDIATNDWTRAICVAVATTSCQVIDSEIKQK